MRTRRRATLWRAGIRGYTLKSAVPEGAAVHAVAPPGGNNGHYTIVSGSMPVPGHRVSAADTLALNSPSEPPFISFACPASREAAILRHL